MIKYLLRLLGIKCAVAGIIVNRNKIFLTKRFRGIVEVGKWCLPGGSIKKWEKSEDAIKRELKEETGFRAKKIKFLFYHDEFVRRLNFHALVLVFRIEIDGSGKNNWEVSDSGWFSRREIKKLDLAFTHREILEKFWRLNEN